MENQEKYSIKDYETLIKNHAKVALFKCKNPSIYDLEDLYQEGVYVFLRAKRRYKFNKITSFKTYFIKSLRGHYCSIVHKSYKSINHPPNSETISFIIDCKKDLTNPSTAIQCMEIFKSEELNYLTFLLNPPVKITKTFENQVGKRRQIIRKELQLTRYKETCIRKQIKHKLETCYA